MIRNKSIPWTSRLRRNKCQWPDPEASIGTFYRKMGRDSSCWEAVGAARETFIRIADEIKNHLEKASEPVPQAVTWTMYMIGKTKETAEPMILFCCRESASRKQVRTTVEESGILQRYPGVRVGDASRPPDFDQLVQLAGESSGSLGFGQNAKTKKLEFRCEADGRLYANRNHLGYTFESVIGNRIFVTLPGNDGTIRKATIGGIVESGLRQFYLTAGHAFESPVSEASEDGGGDFDFDIGEESDLEAEEDFIDSTSRGSLSPERADYSSSDEFSMSTGVQSDISPNSTGKSISRAPPRELNYTPDTADSGYGSTTSRGNAFKNREVHVGGILRARINQDYPTLDYALIEITKSRFIEDGRSILESGLNSLVVFKTIEFVPQNTKILAITGSGRILEGTISGTPTYNTAGANKVHELWTIKLDGRLEEGDCGSWVVGVGSGVFYGHIVAGSPESGAAYVVPAHQIFRDAKNRFDIDLRLPTKKPLEVEASTLVSKGATTASSNTSASLAYASPVLSPSHWSAENVEDNSIQGAHRSGSKRPRELLPWGHETSGPAVEPGQALKQEAENERNRVGPNLSSLTPPSSPTRSPARNAKDFPAQGEKRRRRSQQPTQSPNPYRWHRKERIVIVDAPPRPRSPPQFFNHTFTPPSSTSTTPEYAILQVSAGDRAVSHPRPRPVIVDERPLHRARARSIEGVGDRPRRARSSSRSRMQWDSPSSSHTSFDDRARQEARDAEYREEQRHRVERERSAVLEAERRRRERIRQQDEEIRRRPAVPIQSVSSRHRPEIDQSQDLKRMMAGLSLSEEDSRNEEVDIRRRRMEELERRARMDRLEEEEEEALKRRLRERQMPKRRSSVGPGNRRHRVLYDDGIYRWE
ncbi:hypothetical protein N431DRAFT_564050 [Stipitochalara longipes BDJ]|nr:hypothetical protein N431DRAFT_564050 [Stipitochalara longipes BDJ]